MKLLRTLSIILLILLVISAMSGGIMLMTDPTGYGMQLPIEYLEPSPFANYFFPGLVLVLSNGISSTIVLIIIILKHKYYPWVTIYQGIIIVGWIIIQMIMIQVLYFLQFVFIAIGIILIIAGTIQTSHKNPLIKKSNRI